MSTPFHCTILYTIFVSASLRAIASFAFILTMKVMMNEYEVTEEEQVMANNPFFENLIEWFQKVKSDNKLDFYDSSFTVQ